MTSSITEDAWGEYELFGLWLHAACRSSPDRIIQGQAPTASSSNLGICSRDEFRDVYEYIVSFGVEFKVAQLIPFVSAEARIGLESEAREFYAERYPQINYTGLVVRTLDEEGNIVVRPQSEKPFYWPVHYLEPIDGNELAIDLDVALMDKEFIDYVTTTWKPALGGGFKLVQDTDESAYSVALYHPGVPVSSEPNKEKPTEIAAILVRIPDLLTRSARLISATSLTVFLFDAHDDAKDPSFLGGVTIKNLPGESHNSNLTWLAETNLTELPAKNSTRHVERIIQVGNREWIVAVESVDGTFSPDVLFIVIGAAMIFSASLMLAFWFQAHITRLGKLDMIKREAAAEKAALIVETARKQASKERQLNEYIAHVRPVMQLSIIQVVK